MKRIVIPVAAVAVLVIGTAWWAVLRNVAGLPDVDVVLPPSAPSTQGGAGSSQVIVLPGTSAGERPRMHSVAPASIALREEIRAVSDLRAYYERVKGLPDPTGERSYRLGNAISECALYVDKTADEVSRRFGIDASAAQNPRRTEMLNQAFARCKGFNGMGAGLAQAADELHARAKAAGYPAALALSLRSEAATREREKTDAAAIRLLETSPEPEVLAEIQHYLTARNGDRVVPPGVPVQAWFNGWSLLQCDYGADCGPQSSATRFACLTRGICDAAGTEEAIFLQGGQGALTAAGAQRDALLRRIADRNWAALGFTERSNK